MAPLRGRRDLLVFLKAPEPGRVKTRLAKQIGPDLAALVYRGLAESVMSTTAPSQVREFERVVCFAPPEAEPEIAAWFPSEVLETQSRGDLGDRMDQAFVESFARGAGASVLIGTDCLSIDRGAVLAAFDALDDADVVIRTALDGGYTLIGLKHHRWQSAAEARTALFKGIPWSTDAVLSTTLDRASAAGLHVAIQGPDADIDTLEDLQRHWPRVRLRLERDVVRRIEGTAFFAPPA